MKTLLDQIEKFLSHNTISGWLITAAIALFLAFIIKVIMNLVFSKLHKFAKKTPTVWDTVVLEMFGHTKTVVIFMWLFFIASKKMEPDEFSSKVILILFVITATYQVSVWGLHLLESWHNQVLSPKMIKNPASSGALGLMYRFMIGGFLLLLILIALSNVGINIAALVAGLGVGGIAVALAAQNVLGDLFASLSIVFDKPFCVGDFIFAGNEKGTVEQIGIKTTRLRSLSGEQLVISNKNLLDSRIQNFKRMTQRRGVQRFGVVYNTPIEALEKIPIWVKDICDAQPKMKLDRCHLATYGSSALEYELVFYVLDRDYTVFMATQQEVLLEIFKKFKLENVQYAFSTHTLYVENVEKHSV